MPRRKRFRRHKKIFYRQNHSLSIIPVDNLVGDRLRDNDTTFDVSKLSDVSFDLTHIISPICTLNSTPPCDSSSFLDLKETHEICNTAEFSLLNNENIDFKLKLNETVLIGKKCCCQKFIEKTDTETQTEYEVFSENKNCDRLGLLQSSSQYICQSENITISELHSVQEKDKCRTEIKITEASFDNKSFKNDEKETDHSVKHQFFIKTSTPTSQKKVPVENSSQTYNIDYFSSPKNNKTADSSKFAISLNSNDSKHNYALLKRRKSISNCHKMHPCGSKKYASPLKNSKRRVNKINISRNRSGANDKYHYASTSNKVISSKLLSKIGKGNKLPQKLADFLSWLGVTLKKLMPSIFANKRSYFKCINFNNSQVSAQGKTSIKCCKNCEQHEDQFLSLSTEIGTIKKEYQLQISKLSSKIEGYNLRLDQIKEDHQKQVACLEDQMNILKHKLEKQEEHIQKSSACKCLNFNTEQISKIASMSPNGMPPPPPPPLPPPFVPKGFTTKVVLNSDSKKHLKGTDENRPIISLDDILKVKLRKATDRKDRKSPLRRVSSFQHSIQPRISSDMLRQIKLKPTSRSQTPSIDSNPSSPNASPQTSLIRILSNVDTNVKRVKRLRRSNGYSFDDIFRGRSVIRNEHYNNGDTD